MIEDEIGARAWLLAGDRIDEDAVKRIETLVQSLAEENQVQNLVSRPSLDEVWRRHIVDSAQLLDHVPRGTMRWLDLGTGAGFPGLVIAALRPDMSVVMVESRKRRIDWLKRACLQLRLDNATVAGCRVEDLATQTFDVISARAFAPLDRLLELSARFSTSDTIWLLPKGRSAQKELDELRGWKAMFHVEQSLTDADSGVIVGTLLGRKGKSA